MSTPGQNPIGEGFPERGKSLPTWAKFAIAGVATTTVLGGAEPSRRVRRLVFMSQPAFRRDCL